MKIIKIIHALECELKINLFSLQLVYFFIETQVSFYALVSVDNNPFIWCMVKLGAKKYIAIFRRMISLWTNLGLIYQSSVSKAHREYETIMKPERTQHF
jgi:hypothetical protein